jgi:hypothetical protein
MDLFVSVMSEEVADNGNPVAPLGTSLINQQTTSQYKVALCRGRVCGRSNPNPTIDGIGSFFHYRRGGETFFSFGLAFSLPFHVL